MADREDFDRFMESQYRSAVRSRADDLRRLELAVPPAHLLTQDENWDLFLKVLQAMIDKAKASEATHVEHLMDPSEVTHEQILQTKIEGLMVRQAVITMEEIREIPKTLIERGERARELLREHGLEVEQ